MIKAYQQNNLSGMRLDANESPWNLPDWLKDEILYELSRLEYNRYPDDEYLGLRKAYGSYVDLEPEKILAGNGSDQMLQLIITYFAPNGDRMMSLDPDFSMYDFYSSLLGKGVEKYPLDFEGLDLESFIDTIREKKPFLVLFSNPHNPSGLMLSSQQVARLCEQIAPIPLCVDEAYMDFDGDSAIPLLEEHDNLWITRTLSKAFGLAGCRIGFLLSSPENIEKIRPYKIVYNIPQPTASIAQSALRHHKWFQKRIDYLKDQRDWMEKELRQVPGIEVIPSHANYLCLRSPYINALVEAFKAHNIAVRVFESRDYLRLTIGTRRQNDQVLHIIRKCIEHETGSHS